MLHIQMKTENKSLVNIKLILAGFPQISMECFAFCSKLINICTKKKQYLIEQIKYMVSVNFNVVLHYASSKNKYNGCSFIWALFTQEMKRITSHKCILRQSIYSLSTRNHFICAKYWDCRGHTKSDCSNTDNS